MQLLYVSDCDPMSYQAGFVIAYTSKNDDNLLANNLGLSGSPICDKME